MTKGLTGESYSGPLFAFAGIDGAGKSTLVNNVANELRIMGHEVHVSKAYTQEHKNALKSFIETADDVEIMFMFQALQRRQRNDAIARLALGNIVLADRWSESYEAFHSQNGVLSENDTLRHSIDELAFEGLSPLNTFYIQTKADVAMRRSHNRGADFFDAKAIDYHKRQAFFYDRYAADDPSWVVLDGHSEPGKLTGQVLEIIKHSLPVPQISSEQ